MALSTRVGAATVEGRDGAQGRADERDGENIPDIGTDEGVADEQCDRHLDREQDDGGKEVEAAGTLTPGQGAPFRSMQQQT